MRKGHTEFWSGNLKKPCGRPRHTQDDNIKADIKEMGYQDEEWIHLALYSAQQQALVIMVMNLMFH